MLHIVKIWERVLGENNSAEKAVLKSPFQIFLLPILFLDIDTDYKNYSIFTLLLELKYCGVCPFNGQFTDHIII